MPQRIEVPGMGIVEFPDGMSDDQIAQAIKRNMQPQKPAMSGAERLGMGLADPIHGGAQLLTKMLPEGVVSAGNRLNNFIADNTGLVARLPEGGVDQQVRERESDYQQRKPDGFDWMRLAGNVASPVNLALGAAAAPARAASLGTKMAAGAVTSAGSGALAPVTGADFASEKAQQIGLAAMFGLATPAAMAGVARTVSPRASTDAGVQLLKESGVKPSIGQTLGGVANKIEEKLQSVPIMGDAIAASRGRAVDQLNLAAINRATAPIGVTVKKGGQEGIKEAGDALSQAYDDVLAGLKAVNFDGQWKQDFGQLKQMARALPEGVRGTFRSKAKSLIEDRISKAGGMTAQTMKDLDSELGQLARRYGKSAIASEQDLGDAFLQAQALLRDQVARNSPQAAERLKAINTGWANLVRVEKAGAKAVNNDGIFSPAQLNLAIREAEQSVRKRATSRGTALMQDLGNAGSRLGNKVPNSGTVDRAMLGGAGIGAGLIDPTIPLALGGGAAAYTPMVQDLLRYLVTARPAAAQSVAGLLNQSAPMLGPAGGLLGLQIGNQ